MCFKGAFVDKPYAGGGIILSEEGKEMQIMKRKMFGVIASIAMILSLFVLPTNVNAESSAKNIYKEEEFINALNDSNINNPNYS